MPSLNINFNKRVDNNSITRLLIEIQNGIDAGYANINVILETHGGNIEEAFRFYDTFQKYPKRNQISVYNSNHVESAGIVVYLGFVNRLSLRNATFLIHASKKQGASSLDAKAVKINHYMGNIIANETKIDLQQFQTIVQSGKDFCSDANQASTQEICFSMVDTLPTSDSTIDI